MAVGDEWAHLESDGEHERFTMKALGGPQVGRVAARGNLAEDVESPRLLVRDSRAGELERLVRRGRPRPCDR